MKKVLSAAIVCISATQFAGAQDIHFSQFYENAILNNPALTGIFSGDYKVGVNYRTQWSEISVPFRTVMASAETRIAVNREVGDYLSFGVAATYDRAGTINFNSMQVYPALNYNKAIEDKHNSYLSFGFAGGYIQRSIDLSKATYSTQYSSAFGYDPLASSGENMANNNITAYDLAAGISLNSSAGPANNVNYYLGVAAYHLNKPKQTFNNEALSDLDTKYRANFGLKCSVTDQFSFTIHSDYTAQGRYSELVGGGLVSWRSNPEKSENFALYAGVFIRYKDAYIPTVKMDYEHYSVTLSYDINTSSLKPASNGAGGFEISLFARGIYKKNAQSGEQMRCPRFEQMLQSSLQSF